MATIWALCVRNIKDFTRSKIRLIFTIVFPFFFIYLFSEIFRVDGIDDPISFMLAGIAIAMVFEIALRISSSTIDDMTSGFMKEVLVSPVSRLSIAGGQFLSSAIIATFQGAFILIGGVVFGFRVSNFTTIPLMVLAMIFVGFVFAGFGLFIACNTKSQQSFQLVQMALTMPMMFLSGAYMLFSFMPPALQVVGYFNPLTYAVLLFRIISLEQLHLSPQELYASELTIQIGNTIVTPALAILVLAVFGALFLALATISFARTDFSKMNRSWADVDMF